MAYALTDRAVRKLTEIIQGQRGNKGGGGTHGASAWIDDFPLPFTVRWSATANNWVIWLPSPSGLVCVDGDGVTITGASAAQSLPSGWYTVSGVSGSSTAVYLNITIPDEDQTGVTTTAALSGTASSSSTGNKVYPLTVATMATDSSTGAKTVRQSLCSVVALGAAKEDEDENPEPDDKSLDTIPEPPPESTDPPTGNEGKWQIKGWKDADPSESNSVGKIIAGNGGTDEEGEKLICRKSDGTLAYRAIGKMTDDGGGYWETGGDETTCNATKIKIGNVLIYEV